MHIEGVGPRVGAYLNVARESHDTRLVEEATAATAATAASATATATATTSATATAIAGMFFFVPGEICPVTFHTKSHVKSRDCGANLPRDLYYLCPFW